MTHSTSHHLGTVLLTQSNLSKIGNPLTLNSREPLNFDALHRHAAPFPQLPVLSLDEQPLAAANQSNVVDPKHNKGPRMRPTKTTMARYVKSGIVLLVTYHF